MRVRVDTTRCMGHTLCTRTAPDVFDMDDVEGHSVVVLDEVPEPHRDAVRRAALNCPEGAIVVDESGGGGR